MLDVYDYTPEGTEYHWGWVPEPRYANVSCSKMCVTQNARSAIDTPRVGRTPFAIAVTGEYVWYVPVRRITIYRKGSKIFLKKVLTK